MPTPTEWYERAARYLRGDSESPEPSGDPTGAFALCPHNYWTPGGECDHAPIFDNGEPDE